MRHLQQNEEETVDNFRPAIAVGVGAHNRTESILAPSNLVTSASKPLSTVSTLLEQSSRDSTLIETLNALRCLGNTFLLPCIVAAAQTGNPAIFVVLCGMGIGINISMVRALNRGYLQDAALYSELGPEAVTSLIDSLSRSNARVEQVVSRVLAQLLPTLSSEQFHSLSTDTRQELYVWLRDGSSSCADSKIEILRGIAPVADAGMVGFVEQIIGRWAFTPAQRRLRRESRIVLAQVLERIEAESDENGLASHSALAVHEHEDLETTEESRALLAEIRKHSQSRSSPGMRVGYLIANWCFITPYVLFKFCESVSQHAGFMQSSAWLVGTAVSSQLFRLALTPTHTRVVRQLANTGDVNAVGALAEALEWPDEELQTVARGALIRLLPALTTSDTGLLNSRQKRCLNNKLVMANSKNYLDSELQVKILSAWEKVGDRSSLQAVKSLAASRAVLQNERKVQKAALQCLPILEERASLNESSQMLLRASSITESGTETLVRPASATGSPDAELVRPSEQADTI